MLTQTFIGELRYELAVETFVNESGTAAGDIHQLADQVGIDACGEILEIEVDVIDARSEFGGKVIPQVFRIQVVEIGARHDKGAA